MGRWEAAVVGRVIDAESGLPVPEIRVEASVVGIEDGPSGYAVTDAQGGFRVELSQLGTFPQVLAWQLQVNPEPDIASSYQDELRLDGLSPLLRGETRCCDASLGRGIEVAVRVERPDGMEANGLLRACRGPRERSIPIQEGRAEPFFVARTGPHALAASRVRACVNPFAPSAWVDLGTCLCDGRRVDVLIRIGAGARLSGRVVWTDGRPCPKAWVRVWSVGNDPDEDEEECLARCDGEGAFAVAGLEAGERYWVRAGFPNLHGDQGGMDGPTQAAVGEHVELRLEPTSRVPFPLVVRHGDGSPVQMHVQLRYRDEAGDFVHRIFDLDDEGRCLVTCLLPGQAAEVMCFGEIDSSPTSRWRPIPSPERDPGALRILTLPD